MKALLCKYYVLFVRIGRGLPHFQASSSFQVSYFTSVARYYEHPPDDKTETIVVSS